MAQSVQIGRTWLHNSEFLTNTENISAEQVVAVTSTIVAGGSLTQSVSITKANLQALYIDTNVSGLTCSLSGTPTITLASGIPIFWTSTSTLTNPLTTNVSTITYNNPTTSDAVSEIRTAGSV